MNSLTALPHDRCPVCGAANQCVAATSGRLDLPCWCQTASITAEALARVPTEWVGRACLCPRCAGLDLAPAPASAPVPGAARPEDSLG